MNFTWRLRRLAGACLVALATLWPRTPAMAWARHDLITQVSLKPLNWLNLYDHILVTPYSYNDPDQYNLRFKPKYVGPGVAHLTTARDILITYCDEPDWDMDTGLNLSRMQPVMGGSQGFRHQYYQILLGFVHFGVAPERGQHFYDMARQAFQRGDRYWGFRYLARMIHYVQDVNQPYHTRPIRFAWLWESRLNLSRLVRLGKNMHYAFEHYQSAHLLGQLQAKPTAASQPYLLAMAAARPQPVNDVESYIRRAAQINYSRRSNQTLKANDAYWPDAVRSKEPAMQSESEADLFGRDGSAEQQYLDELTARSLQVTAQDTQSLLEYARQTIIR